MNHEERNYDSYYRVNARRRAERSPFVSVGRETAEVEVYDPDADEERIETVPVKREICPTCEGTGSHVNPSIDAGGLSADDFHDDPDFAEDYMRGMYDVPCYECGGEKVVVVIDRERCDDEILKLLDDKEQKDQEYEAIRRAERRMGA